MTKYMATFEEVLTSIIHIGSFGHWPKCMKDDSEYTRHSLYAILNLLYQDKKIAEYNIFSLDLCKFSNFDDSICSKIH